MTYSDASKGGASPKLKSKILFWQPENEGFLKLKAGKSYQWILLILERIVICAG